ncbi:TadE family type IV pilus minor pilin [Actinophytocola sediminis]
MPAPGKPDNDSGMVTVEAGMVFAGFVLVLALCLSSIAAAMDQLKCTDAAREAARLTARGEQDKAVSTARQIAPDDAVVRISTTGDKIHVSVTAAPASGLIPGLELSADAYAIAEPNPEQLP